MLFANVAVCCTNGGDLATLTNGDAVALAHPGTGLFNVTFAQDVSGCAATVTPGFTAGAGGLSNFAATAGANTNTASTVQVRFFRQFEGSAQPTNSSFHLIVVC